MQQITFGAQRKINIFYINDTHCNIPKMSQCVTASDCFDRKSAREKAIPLKIAAGDITFATDENANTFELSALRRMNFDILGIGNKEVESGNFFLKAYENSKAVFKLLSINLKFLKPNLMQDKIVKSSIIERNGLKLGFVGITAFDSDKIDFRGDFNDFVSVDSNYKKVIAQTKKEVDALKKQGVQFIGVLAHTGIAAKSKTDEVVKYYREVAKIEGVNVIFGGHDHYEVNEWLYSPSGKPVKVVAVEAANDVVKTSSDLAKVGFLRATFDDETDTLIQSKTKNRFPHTRGYKKASDIEALREKLLNEKEFVCKLEKPLRCNARKTTENPVANLLTDAMLWMSEQLNPQNPAQIAIVNSGEIRQDLTNRHLRIKDVKNVFRFTQNVSIVETELTAKQIIKALEFGVKTTKLPKTTLGLLQVGGLEYQVDGDKVKNVYITDKSGKRIECLDKASSDKTYKVLYDTYLLQGAGDIKVLKRKINDPRIKIYSENHQSAVIKYLKSFGEKVVSVRTGRIHI